MSVKIYSAHPPEITGRRATANPAVTKNHKIRCSHMAAMVQVSRSLEKQFLEFSPTFFVAFARGGLPLAFALIERLRAASEEDKSLQEKYLSLDPNRHVFHFFPSIAGAKWKDLADPKGLFVEEMLRLIDQSSASPVKIMLFDTTFSGNALNRALKAVLEISSKSAKSLEVFFAPAIDVSRSKAPGGWELLRTRAACPEAFKGRAYSEISDRPIQLTSKLVVRIFYHEVELFTEDVDELVGGVLLPDWPVLVPVEDSGRFNFTRSSGEVVTGSSGRDSSAHRIPSYLAESWPHPSQEEWLRLDAEASTAPAGVIKDAIEYMSLPFGADLAFEAAMASRGERLSEAEVFWIGRYALSPVCFDKVRLAIPWLKGIEAKESALDFLSRIRPDVAVLVPEGLSLDETLKWWLDRADTGSGS